jgi:hypothetical protein
MLVVLRICLPTLARFFRKRHKLVVENLLCRHQLQVALRSRPRPHLKTRDRCDRRVLYSRALSGRIPAAYIEAVRAQVQGAVVLG